MRWDGREMGGRGAWHVLCSCPCFLLVIVILVAAGAIAIYAGRYALEPSGGTLLTLFTRDAMPWSPPVAHF